MRLATAGTKSVSKSLWRWRTAAAARVMLGDQAAAFPPPPPNTQNLFNF